MTNNTYTYCLLLISLLLVSCADELPYEGISPIGSGECSIEGTLTFKPFTEALASRAQAGDAIETIESLCVLVYDTDNNLVLKSPMTPGSAAAEGVYATNDAYNQANFKLTLPYGKYYIYAVANMGDLAGYDDVLATADGLKNISLPWNATDIAANNQMLGTFYADNSASAMLTINSATKRVRAAMRRAVSKITVAFDGTQLNDDVTIYLKSVKVRDIPASCLLGANNSVTSAAGLIALGDSILYPGGAAYNSSWASQVSKQKPHYFFADSVAANYGNDETAYAAMAHADGNASLFFFENMQGTGADKRQDANADGVMDAPDRIKDNMPCGTYVEVEAYYISNNAGRRGQGPITYRFMLGKDIINDYNAERNYHYKLTLMLKNWANDYDWHIDYKSKTQFLAADEPGQMNYRGEVFVPDKTKYNWGQNFTKDNTIRVQSYWGDDTVSRQGTAQAWTLSFCPDGQSVYSDTAPQWLTYTVGGSDDDLVRDLTFHASSDYVAVDIDENLRNATPKSGTFNLADTDNPGSSNVVNTANCYMVDAQGTYIFPLVYGNAIAGGNTNASAYQKRLSGDNYLEGFRTHMNTVITDPYLANNGCVAKDAVIVWQDAENLVTDVTYMPAAYGNKGGIRFTVGSNIKQGNAVIAVRDAAGTIMWSWHIWVTRLDFEKDIKVMTSWNTGRKSYNLMSVNLGWCSGYAPDGTAHKVLYYPGRSCKVKITAGEMEQVVTVTQHPHSAVTCGNSPYYQWGRKDPFVGSETPWGNKRRWDGNGTLYDIWSSSNPARLFDDSADSLAYKRKTTRQILPELIKHPDLWHNPPRQPNLSINGEFISDNESYDNLWDADAAAGDTRIKTVYDPCPVGYSVAPIEAYSIFSMWGGLTGDHNAMVEVLEKDTPTDMGSEAGVNSQGAPETVRIYTDHLYEFHFDYEDKYESIIFPVSGYRDWDAYAGVIQLYGILYAWSTKHASAANAYNFEASRFVVRISGDTGFVNADNAFYDNDGFPVRPCRQ